MGHDDSCFSQKSSRKSFKKWSDSGYILKTEACFPSRLDMG